VSPAVRESSLRSPEEIRARYAELAEEVGPRVTIVAATKYVALEDMTALAEAGVPIAGENRAQDLEAKHARLGTAFRWHFIGHLQSRKAPAISATCELCHSLSSESAARRLTIPALVEVNLSGEATKSGIPATELPWFLDLVRELGVEVRGLMTMPPAASDPEASRPYFAELRTLADTHGLAELSMGTSQDYRVAAAEGATLVRLGSTLWQA
jgi:uncharacterized pyridoxal phosphate-containing UPF0001 family protein